MKYTVYVYMSLENYYKYLNVPDCMLPYSQLSVTDLMLPHNGMLKHRSQNYYSGTDTDQSHACACHAVSSVGWFRRQLPTCQPLQL